MPNAYVFSLLIGTTIGALYFIIGYVFGLETVRILDLYALGAGVVFVPVGVMLTYQRQYFLVQHMYKLSKANFAFVQVMPLVGYLILFAFDQISVNNFIILYVGTNILCMFIFNVINKRISPETGAFSIELAKHSFSFGFRQFFSDLALYLTLRLDYFLVVLYLGKSELGIYSVAMGLAEITSRLTNEIGTMLFPMFASGDEGARRAIPILRVVFFVAVLIATVLAVFSDFIVRILFGNQFSQAVPSFRWLLLGTVAWSTIHVTWTHASADGKPELGILVFSAAAAIDVSLNVLFIPRMGIVGASIAATISYIVAALVFFIVFCKVSKCSFREALIIKKRDIKAVLWVFIHLLNNVKNKSDQIIHGRLERKSDIAP